MPTVGIVRVAIHSGAQASRQPAALLAAPAVCLHPERTRKVFKWRPPDFWRPSSITDITTVSARVARLEQRLGVTLIQRTTRQLHVTPVGMAYYEHCARALAEIAEGERELAEGLQEPKGRLRITAPADLAHALLTPAIDRFLAAYPKVSVELTVTNRRVDLIGEDIDLAVRVGPFQDSSLVIRKFRSGHISFWAAREYLARRGVPKTPADLLNHDVVQMSRLTDNIEIKSPTGELIDLGLPSRLASDDFETLRSFLARGSGIGLLPDFLVETALDSSCLVLVLPEYRSDVVSTYLAYPAQRFVPLPVRAFIESATATPSASGAADAADSS